MSRIPPALHCRADLVELPDQDTVAKLVELDSIVDELQRANERVAKVERRNEMLRSEIERARSESGETERSVALPVLSAFRASAVS